MIYVFPPWSASDSFKKSYTVVTLDTSSFVSFFKVLFLKYVLKILARFLAFTEGGQKLLKAGILYEHLWQYFFKISFALVCIQTKY